MLRYNSSMLAEQLELPIPNRWGGARKGAGRPKGSGRSSRMPHTRRPRVSEHRPHHVTVRMTRGTWNLRSQRCFAPIRAALALVRRRVGFRVVQFSVQHNHLHLVTEAVDRATLSKGMRVLLMRIARGLNQVMGSRGRRVADRYHEHILGTPTEVRNALRYVIGNRLVHLARWGQLYRSDQADSFSSLAERPEPLVRPPRSWLLREGWTRAGPF